MTLCLSIAHFCYGTQENEAVSDQEVSLLWLAFIVLRDTISLMERKTLTVLLSCETCECQ